MFTSRVVQVVTDFAISSDEIVLEQGTEETQTFHAEFRHRIPDITRGSDLLVGVGQRMSPVTS